MKRLLSLILVLISSISLAYAAVNLNTATVDELDGVKGIGPSKAKAIVDHRSKNGPFKSVDVAILKTGDRPRFTKYLAHSWDALAYLS